MAKIYFLIKCTVCKKRLKENDSYTEWEKEYYCEPCFDEYLEIVTPADFLIPKNNKSNKDDN